MKVKLVFLVGLTGCAAFQAAGRGDLNGAISAGADEASRMPQVVSDVANLKCQQMTPSEEYYFGRAVTAQIVQGVYEGKALPATSRTAMYVNRVGQQVAVPFALAQADPPDRPEPYRGFTFVVVESKDVNAHGIPGGFVVVTSGLVAAARSEDALAGALAHEVSHVRRGHGAYAVEDKLCLMMKTNAAVRSAASNMDLGLSQFPVDKLADFMNELVQWIVDRLKSGYDRRFEDEADLLGAQIAWSSGYDPARFAAMLDALDKAQAASSSTHGTYAERAAAVTRLVSDKKLSVSEAGRSGASIRDGRYRTETTGIARQAALIGRRQSRISLLLRPMSR